MTHHDPLESELFNLRPRELSPKLKHRIADQFSVQLPSQANRRSRSVWWMGACSGGIVAMLLALMPRHTAAPSSKDVVPNVIAQPSIDVAVNETLPSVWAYRAAAMQSSEALDALFDQHANRIHEHHPERARDVVFARFFSDSEKISGEL